MHIQHPVIAMIFIFLKLSSVVVVVKVLPNAVVHKKKATLVGTLGFLILLTQENQNKIETRIK